MIDNYRIYYTKILLFDDICVFIHIFSYFLASKLLPLWQNIKMIDKEKIINIGPICFELRTVGQVLYSTIHIPIKEYKNLLLTSVIYCPNAISCRQVVTTKKIATCRKSKKIQLVTP